VTKTPEFSAPIIEAVSQKDTVVFKVYGMWLAKTARDAELVCEELLKKTFPKTLFFDLTQFEEFDTSGIWLLQRTIQAFEHKGHHVKIQNASKTFLTLLSRLEPYKPSFETAPKFPSFFGTRLAHIGKTSIDIALLTRDLITFLGQVTVGFFIVFLHPRRLRLTSIVVHMERFGVNAIPIIVLISMALGLVLAYQGEEQLRRFGAEIYTINLVSISVVREVGILITAILVAGRTGSSITAQIGIMKINQEVDALNTLGLSPMEVLIIPRILALILVMPCLAFIADLAGLLGGGIMVVLSLDVSSELYIYRIAEAVTIGGFWIGIIKAPLFGAIIGVVSCFEGMRVKGTAESVGICTTRSVVEGIFLVTLADALLSVFFSKVGI
jgi:phospholipid/cholesterol/gamma-HCH transport system permease protein